MLQMEFELISKQLYINSALKLCFLPLEVIYQKDTFEDFNFLVLVTSPFCTPNEKSR